jgi:hypothetical protein
MQPPQFAQSEARPEPVEWDAALGRGESCLKANAQRVRVRGRNPARAALSALKRRGIGVVDAWKLDLNIAVFARGQASPPRAVFAVAGPAEAPELQLRFARMLPQDSRLHTSDGPLEAEAVWAEVPSVIRRKAEIDLGRLGIRAILTEAFWQREVSVYVGTALVLMALGFPMTPAVFIVGAVLILLHGAARLGWDEVRLRLRRHHIARDPATQSEINRAAGYRVLIRALGLNPDKPLPALGQHVLGGDIAVPDGFADHAVRLLVDEDARVDLGGLSAPGMQDNPEDDGDSITLPDTDGRVTVVFRSRKPRLQGRGNAPPVDLERETDTHSAGHAGSAGGVPAKLDVTEIGSRRPSEDEDIEVIDAELLDPDDDVPPGPTTAT